MKLSAQQRLEVARILDGEMRTGATPERAMKLVGTMFPTLTVGDMKLIVREHADRLRAAAKSVNDEAAAEDEFAAVLLRCPAFAAGKVNVSEAVDWLAEHGAPEDQQWARRYGAWHDAGRFREQQVARAVTWSPWMEALPRDEFRFRKGHPYGPSGVDQPMVSRLLVDFLAHDLKTSPPTDYDADPRVDLLWKCWRETIPPHVRLRIDNAPTEADRRHWIDHATHVEPGIPEAMCEVVTEAAKRLPPHSRKDIET
jgi:hypothetical protein